MDTRDDRRLLAAIRKARGKAGEGQAGTVTTSEMAELLHCGNAKALRVIHQMVRAGELEPSMVERENIQRWTQLVHGYRIPKKKGA